MEYSDLILRRLRESLERYRMKNRVNGRTRSWSQVAFDIVDTADLDEAAIDAMLKAEAESLRRFAAGTQTPTPERLDRVRDFLLEEGSFTEDELLKADILPADVRGLLGFFEFEADRIWGVPGCLIANRSAPHGRRELRILKIAKRDGCIAVEEAVHWTDKVPYVNDLDALENYLERHSKGRLKREGWLVESPSKQIVIYFKDRVQRSLTYSSVIFDGRQGGGDIPRNTFWVLDHAAFSNPDGFQAHFPEEHGPNTNLTELAVANWTAAQLCRYEPKLLWSN